MKAKLLLTFQPNPAILDRARVEFDVIDSGGALLSYDDIIRLANQGQAQALYVSHGQSIDAKLIAALPASVRVIATSSVGYDHLDLSAAADKHITLTNTPDVLSECCADLTMMLVLNAARRGREYLEIMQRGWNQNFGQSEMLGTSLKGKTLGIFGMGGIGQQLAHRARAFGMKISYSNRRRLSPELELGATYFAKLEDMLPQIDFLSLHAPYSRATHHVMNERTFALMKNGSHFINAGRGALVDECALLAALDSGRIRGAGLDVFEAEPNFNQRFLKYHQVFLTPHMASATVETRNAMGFLCLDNIHAVLAGKPPLTPITLKRA